MIKKGLFFGSFDPIHNGHIEIVEFFINNKILNEVIFVVTPENPFKSRVKSHNFKKRYEAVEIATMDNPKIIISDIESKLPSPNFTCDTLKFLRTEKPEIEYVFLMGSDLLEDFDKWKNYKDIINHHNLYVYPRVNKNSIPEKFKSNLNIKLFDAPLMEVSSSLIREKYKNGESITDLVPLLVLKFIEKNNLYTI